MFLNIIKSIQFNPLMIKPEIIVDKLHVAAIRDKASVLFSDVVFLITKGKEQTLISIMPKPHNKNDNCIRGIIP